MRLRADGVVPLLASALCVCLTAPLPGQGYRITILGGIPELTGLTPGVIVRARSRDLPLALHAQVGYNAAGLGAELDWKQLRIGPFNDAGEGAFLSVGLDRAYHRADSTIRWGDFVAVGGIRIPFAEDGGPVFDLGVGIDQPLGGTTQAGYTVAFALRLVVGWAF